MYLQAMKTPLYILAEKKNLPENQYLDFETLDWINNMSSKYNLDFNEVDVKTAILIIDSFNRAYEYASKLPLNDSHYVRGAVARASIHGDLHAYRVAITASAISNVYPYNESVIIAGLYHDIARNNDKKDIGHATKSSERACRLGLIPVVDRERVVEAIAHHENELLDVQKEELALFIKTADALDRYRLPKTKWWPDKKLMQHNTNETIFKISYWLMLESELEFIKTNDPKHSIGYALGAIGRRLGL